MEEIISKHFPNEDAYRFDNVYNALCDYGQQQAIAFANYIALNNHKPHDIDTWDGGKLNTHELYHDFINQPVTT